MPNLDRFTPLVLRLGLAVVFAWFGLHQLFDPTSWVVFVPGFAQHLWLSPTTIILLNGWLEVVGAALFIFGFWTRPLAFLLGLHMLFISLDAGGAIGVRDFGITIACLALACATPDRWTLDAIFARSTS